MVFSQLIRTFAAKLGIMKKILIAILALVTLCACHKDDPEEETKAERTVLIYMAAQNNLTYWSGSGFRYAEADLKEIQQGINNLGNNNLVVYVDKAQDPSVSRNDHKPYMLRFRNGELRDSIPMDSTMIACDPATLKAVANKAFTDYPANDYGLVLWGHATGWLIKNDTIASYTARKRAYGGTNLNESYRNSGDVWMNIPTLAKVLKVLPHLKFIFADCCNMMCAECAYELKDVTDYFIGSPAEIPGEGAPYNTVVPAMMEKETFTTSIVDKYAEKYYNRIPLAVIKTSEMVSLATATKTVLQTIKAADKLDQYPNLNNLIYYLDQNLYDMNHFIMTYASEAEYESWKQAFDKAVIYKKYASKWDTMGHVYFSNFEINETSFGSMSMFIPQWKLQSTDNQYIKKFGWYYAAGYDSIGW